MTEDPRVIVDELEAKLRADGDAGQAEDLAEEEQVRPVDEDVSPLTPYVEPTD